MAPSGLARAGLAVVATLSASLLAATPGAADETVRVLFIGNSYTRFNDLPRQVARVAESVPGGPRVYAQRETHSGFGLRGHWRSRRLRSRIVNGRWDAVVLQAHSLAPLRRPAEMTEYARRFATHAGASGARLVLFETWARHPQSSAYRRLAIGPEEMQSRTSAVYAALGRELGAAVAPVGRAWRQAGSEQPSLVLHRRDGTHPAVAGTYLSACVFYGTLTGRDPREARWRPAHMPDEQAARIREIAFASLR